MGTPLEIVKELYAKLTAGDAGGALALMSDDIEWINAPIEHGRLLLCQLSYTCITGHAAAHALNVQRNA